MTYGPTPELIAHVEGLSGSSLDSVLAYIDEQLSPDLIVDDYFDSIFQGYATMQKSRQQLYQEHVHIPGVGIAPYETRLLAENEAFYSMMAAALHSKKQLLEKTTSFWRNHFTVYVKSPWLSPMLPEYENLLRANALGNFKTLLKAVVKSHCMLRFLGNEVNDLSAPNENYARELMELHTLGSDNYFKFLNAEDVPVDLEGRKVGYVEQDVLEAARLLTGFSQDVHFITGLQATGNFQFRASDHDQTDKIIMGQLFQYDPQSPEQELDDLLDLLCEHPLTCQFIAKKLCKYFISDAPDQSTIDGVSQVLHDNWQHPEQIKLALEVLLKSPEFLVAWGGKIKTPYERVLGAMRAVSYDFEFSSDDPNGKTRLMHSYIKVAGQPAYGLITPNGYSFDQKTLLSSLFVMGTWRAQQFLSSYREDSSSTITYHKISEESASHFPDANDWTPNNLVDYWYQRICGVVPSQQIRDELVHFLSYHYLQEVLVEGDPDEPFDVFNHTYALGYKKEQLAAMVLLITMTPEFNLS